MKRFESMLRRKPRDRADIAKRVKSFRAVQSAFRMDPVARQMLSAALGDVEFLLALLTVFDGTETRLRSELRLANIAGVEHIQTLKLLEQVYKLAAAQETTVLLDYEGECRFFARVKTVQCEGSSMREALEKLLNALQSPLLQERSMLRERLATLDALLENHDA